MMLQRDSARECQCHEYQRTERISATAVKRAPIAQPQLSPCPRRAILAGAELEKAGFIVAAFSAWKPSMGWRFLTMGISSTTRVNLL